MNQSDLARQAMILITRSPDKQLNENSIIKLFKKLTNGTDITYPILKMMINLRNQLQTKMTLDAIKYIEKMIDQNSEIWSRGRFNEVLQLNKTANSNTIETGLNLTHTKITTEEFERRYNIWKSKPNCKQCLGRGGFSMQSVNSSNMSMNTTDYSSLDGSSIEYTSRSSISMNSEKFIKCDVCDGFGKL